MSTHRLAVLLHGTQVAWLERGEGRVGARLRYEPSSSIRLSVSMPARARAYPASVAEMQSTRFAHAEGPQRRSAMQA